MKVRAACFHKEENTVSLAVVRKTIQTYDWHHGGSLLYQIETESEVTHLGSFEGGYLVGWLKNGSIAVWKEGILFSHWKAEKKWGRKNPTTTQVVCLQEMSKRFFFVRIGTSTVHSMNFHLQGIELSFNHRKLVTCVDVSQFSHFLATGAIDGSVRLWDSQSGLMKYQFDTGPLQLGVKRKKKDRIPVSAIKFSQFHQNLLATATQQGFIQLWHYDYQLGTAHCVGSSTIASKQWVMDLIFHPWCPILIAITEKGEVKTLHITGAMNHIGVTQQNSVEMPPFEGLSPYFVPMQDTNFLDLSEYSRICMPLLHSSINKNGNILIYGKLYQIEPNSENDIPYFPILTVRNTAGTQSLKASTVNTKISNFLHTEQEFHIPEIIYLDEFSNRPNIVLKSKQISHNGSSKVRSIKVNQKNSHFIQCKNIKQMSTYILVFYERAVKDAYRPEPRNYFKFINLSKGAEDGIINFGLDGGFIDQEGTFVILTDGGDLMKFTLNSDPTTLKITCCDAKPVRVKRIWTEVNNGVHILMYDKYRHVIANAMPESYQFLPQRSFALNLKEMPLDVKWQRDSDCWNGLLLSLLTTERLLILTDQLDVLTEFHFQSNASVHSCIWFGSALLYNTSSTVYCIFPNSNQSIPLCTLDYPSSTLIAVLSDRLVFGCYRNDIPIIQERFLNIVEILLNCLTLTVDLARRNHDQILKVLSLYDSRQITEKTIFHLSNLGLVDISSKILDATINEFSWELKYQLAIQQCFFSKAFQILTSKLNQTSLQDYHVREGNQFYSYLQDLAERSYKQGNVAISAMCYDLIDDMWNLFEIMVEKRNYEAIKLIGKKCEHDRHKVKEACMSHLEKFGEDPKFTDVPRVKFIMQHIRLDTFQEPSNPSQQIDISSTIKVTILNEKKGWSEEKTKFAEVPPIDLSDMSIWMGAVENEKRSKEIDSDGTSGWGNQMDFNKTDVSEPKEEKKSEATISEIPSDKEDNSTRDENTKDDESEKSDSESSGKKLDQDELRKQYLGGGVDDSSSSSDDDEWSSRAKRKKKLFTKIKILGENEKKNSHIAKKSLSLKSGLRIPTNKGRRLGMQPPPTNRRKILVPNGNNSEKEVESPNMNPSIKPMFPVETTSMSASGCFLKSIQLIDQNKYSLARQFFMASVFKLIQDPEQTVEKTNILVCVHYILFIDIVAEFKKVCASKDVNLARLGFVAALLYSISEKLVRPKHKILCQKQAYVYSMKAGNYTLAAEIIEQILPKTPPNYRESVQEALSTCQQNQNREKELIVDIPKKFDWISLQSVERTCVCDFCNATYGENMSGCRCKFCQFGDIQGMEM